MVRQKSELGRARSDEIEVGLVEWDVEKVNISNVKLERCIFRGTSINNAQLHVFVDASQSAKFAIIYFRARCDQISQVSF